MLRQSSLDRVRDELGALEAAAERAGAALACSYSSSDEFEAAQIEARRAAMWVPFQIDGMQVALAGHHVGSRRGARRHRGAGGNLPLNRLRFAKKRAPRGRPQGKPLPAALGGRRPPN